jgi:nucleotide-binding universal stress UspA family protein
MPTIRSILVPSDLSDEAGHALEHACLLAERFSASLALYHSVPMPDHAYAHWAFSHNSAIWSETEREARLMLRQSAERLGRPASVTVERSSSVPRGLLAFIRDTRPDLVVMATHGRHGIEHLVFGSLTEEVVLHSPPRVLCVRRTAQASRLPYRRILVPTDLSRASRLAFPTAAELARAFEAEIVVLHIAHAGAATPAGRPEGHSPLVPTEASLREFCQGAFDGLALTARVEAGHVADGIVRAALAERADMIVMGTRGHDSLLDTLLGSHTERIVRSAHCPVLVA